MVKKTNKLLSAAIAMVMSMAALPMVAVQAYTPWVSDGVVLTTPVTDASGNALTTVTAGEELTVVCNMKAGEKAADGQKATLLLCAYDAKGLICKDGISMSPVELTTSAQRVEASLSVPSNAVTIKTFVWDTRDNRRPLASVGVVGGESTVHVTNITLDGKSFTEFGANVDFSPDVTTYIIPLKASYLTYPKIVVETSNLAAKTTITPKDGSTMPATVQHDSQAQTSSVDVKVELNGVAKTYTLNFVQEVPAISNAQQKLWNSSSNLTQGTKYSSNYITYQEIVANPNWGGLNPRTDKRVSGAYSVGNVDYATLVSSPNAPAKLFSDRDTQFMYDLSPELYGGTVIQVRYSNDYDIKYSDAQKAIGNGAPEDTGEATLKFDINRTATVYVWTGAATATAPRQVYLDNGFTLCNGAYFDDTDMDGERNKNANVMAFKTVQESNAQGTAESYQYSHVAMPRWVQKTFTVEPGESSVTVELPATNDGYHYTIVKFSDGETISNAKVNIGGTTYSQPTQLLYETVLFDELTDAEKETIKTDFTDELRAKVNYGKAIYATDVFHSYKDEKICFGVDTSTLKNAETFCTDWNNDDSTRVNSVDFDINYSCRVYMMANTNNVSVDESWIVNDLSNASIESFPIQKFLHTSGSKNTYVTPKYVYYKDFQVTPGETEHVQLPQTTASTRFVVAVVRTDLK